MSNEETGRTSRTFTRAAQEQGIQPADTIGEQSAAVAYEGAVERARASAADAAGAVSYGMKGSSLRFGRLFDRSNGPVTIIKGPLPLHDGGTRGGYATGRPAVPSITGAPEGVDENALRFFQAVARQEERETIARNIATGRA